LVGAEAPLPGTERPFGPAAWLGAWLPNLLFGVLVVIDTVRLFRHAMWRDEIQAFDSIGKIYLAIGLNSSYL
jgi:hypothetical protein